MKCCICQQTVEREDAPVLTYGAYGHARVLCDRCDACLTALTRGREPEEIREAMEELSVLRPLMDERDMAATGEDYKFYKELFDSLNRFHEVMYDRHRNDHVDTLSRNSLYLSKVSAELNQNVTIMTRAVVVMTVISLMIALSEIVVYDTGWMGGVAYTVATILLSMDVFLIMLNYSREEHIIIENSSNDEGLNLIELLVIITSIISIILGIVSVSKLSLNIIDVSVNEFLLLIMLYNIALLCSRRKM